MSVEISKSDFPALRFMVSASRRPLPGAQVGGGAGSGTGASIGTRKQGGVRKVDGSENGRDQEKASKNKVRKTGGGDSGRGRAKRGLARVSKKRGAAVWAIVKKGEGSIRGKRVQGKRGQRKEEEACRERTKTEQKWGRGQEQREKR